MKKIIYGKLASLKNQVSGTKSIEFWKKSMKQIYLLLLKIIGCIFTKSKLLHACSSRNLVIDSLTHSVHRKAFLKNPLNDRS